ncbi:VIT family protein [Luteipulveratus sp. YIM 133132]|uniref:VIT family protein n=1 Tax=Luteipulveratus flavus TaxID=3031728 RepID=A0ABT6CBU2_9MICO|nr:MULTISPECIES: VIT family protein [unclassified Luteipulveratus]MDE9364908.1 VIT family protein [Luteipulveratus sp. YIM 133132]MDF8266378.1 VIT family protein [Luteipulveratus sp. YIM 133296]
MSHENEPHDAGLSGRLNWLRAGVLGANDGIVSTAGIVVGVAGASTDRTAILVAGIAGLSAGAMSMAVGEYVSVSTQLDSEKAMLALERRELREMPREELDELTQIYEGKGLEPDLARQVAVALTEKDALAAHADAELGIDPEDLTNPWHAAFASFVAFTVGALLPLVAVLLPGPSWRVPVTFVAVLIALAITGHVSARLGSARPGPAVVRNVIGGALAMVITFGIGNLVGGAVG